MNQQWQHEIMSDHNVFARKYRYNVDESKGTPLAKINAEYFNEETNEWRKVRSENSRMALYQAHLAETTKTNLFSVEITKE